MNKILYKKMAEALAQGRDLKQLFTKEEVKQFVIEQIKTKIMLAIAPWLGKLIVVCLVIGVLLAIFFVVFEQLAMIWDGITKTWGHLWSGTMSKVSDEDVSVLYYDLLQQGVDFEEIGAIGEHNYIKPGGTLGTKTWLESFIDKPELHNSVENVLNTNKEREKYTLQYWLDNVTDADRQPVKVNQTKLDYINNKDPDKELSDKIVMVDKVDENGKVVKETLEEAAARKLSEELLCFRGNMTKEGYEGYPQIDTEQGVGLYLKRYLMAEKETFSLRNEYTFVGEGFKGAIIVDNGNEEKTINPSVQMIGETLWKLTPFGIPQAIGDLIGEETYSIEKIDAENGNGQMMLYINTQRSVVDPLNLDNRVTLEDDKISYDITQYVEQFAMPWQYPFAFHQHTLSPDVGFEVALMSHKYHNLYLQVRPVETGVVKVFSDSGSQIGTAEPIRQPQVMVRRISTWYQTIDYDYSKDPNNAWHGVAEGKATNYNEIQQVDRFTPESDTVKKTGVLIETITTMEHHSHVNKKCGHGYPHNPIEVSRETVVTYWGVDDPPPEYYYTTTTREHKCNHGEGSYADCTETTTVHHNFEKQVVVECEYKYEDNPVITISDTIAKQEDVKLTGIEAMTALLLPDPEIDTETKKVTNYDQVAKYYRANKMNEKDLLFISTSAQSIIKSLYDLYDGNKYEYEPTSYDDIEHVIDSEDSSFMIDKSTPQYLSLADNYQPVIELIQFFAANGVIDASSIYGLGEANSFAIMSQWFISGDSVNITSSGNIATLITGSGREVTAPITGTIFKMDDSGYIYIKTAKQGTIYLNNVQLDPSIQIGQTVTKGQKIGVTTGNVSYYRTDDAGQEITNPAEELKQLQTIQFSDYAWPIPDSGNITSRFGARIDPITGKSSRHNGVDIGAKQGTPIVSYMAGEIYKAGYDPDGYGYYIIVKHSDTCYTLYGHMSAFAKKSGAVDKNEVIGYVGSTGRSTGPHLHFEYRTGPGYNDAVDPMSKLSNYSYY